MKQKLALTVPLFLLVYMQLYAQTSAKITGQLNDINGKGLPSATIMLLPAVGEKIIKTTITNQKGIYEIENIHPGNYRVSVSAVGYAQAASDSFNINNNETFTVPAFSLKPVPKSLENVTVVSKKPMIEVKSDRTVFNVENSINAIGSNAFELLQKSPGVVTDKDDVISLKGKNGVKIYIDGRMTQMNNDDLAAYLKSINSSDIESIEIISNPSAKYDAAGNAGVINIKFKKNKKKGFNGSVSSGVNFGITPKINEALSLNFRNNKVNVFSTYSTTAGKRQNEFFIYRVQNDSIYDQSNNQYSKGWTHNFKAGVDYYLNKKSTIGFIATGNFSDMDSKTESSTAISSEATHELGETLVASNTVPENTKNTNLNFNYRSVDTIGHDFSMDADWGLFRKRRTSYQPNYYYENTIQMREKEKIYQNYTPTDINIYTVKADYETNFQKGKLSFGAKYSNVISENTSDFYNVINDTPYLDLTLSNSFKYIENVNAAYINYNKTLNQKWTIQGGLRVENTNSDGTLTRADGVVQPDNKVVRHYTDFFPSAVLSYNVNKINSLSLSYSRRIDRPNYQELNPFEYKLDELTYEKGNAFLKPQYTNIIELTHTFKYKYATTLSFSHVDDYIAEVIDTTDKSHSYLTKENLASQDIVNINFSLPIQIKKWWNIYANINAYHSVYKADLGEGKLIDLRITSGSIYLQQAFTLGKGYTAEVSGFYNAPSVWGGTFKSIAMGGIDMGVQKQLFKGKANLKLNLTDVFKTMKWGGTNDYGGVKTEAHGTWESRQFKIYFTYRFGNTQMKQTRQHKTGSEEENKRTQKSGGFGGG